MEEISRKNEKFMVNRNKVQNKEVRGESPGRKTSTNNTSFQKNSISSINSTQSRANQQKNQMSRNSSSTVLLTNLGLASDSNLLVKKNERSNSYSKGVNGILPSQNMVNFSQNCNCRGLSIISF